MSDKKIEDKITCKFEAPTIRDRALQNEKEQAYEISRNENEQFWQQKFPNYFSLTNDERKIFRDTLINARKNIELRENIHLSELGTIHDEILNVDRKSEISEMKSAAFHENESMESDLENVIVASTTSDESYKESSIAADVANSSAIKKISEKPDIYIDDLGSEDVPSVAEDHSSEFTFMESDLTIHGNKVDTNDYFAFNNINHFATESYEEGEKDKKIGFDSNIKFIPEKDKEFSNTTSSSETVPNWKNEPAELELPKFHELSLEEKTIFFETLKTAYASTVSKEPHKKTEIIPVADVLKMYTKVEGTKSFIVKSNKKDIRVTLEMKIRSKDNEAKRNTETDSEKTESSNVSLVDEENLTLSDIIRQRMTTEPSPSLQKILLTEDDDIKVVFERKSKSNISQELRIESKIQITEPSEKHLHEEKHKMEVYDSESIEEEKIEFKDNKWHLKREEKLLTNVQSNFNENREGKSGYASGRRTSEEKKIAKDEKTSIKEKVTNGQKAIVEERIPEEKMSVVQESAEGEKKETVEKGKAEKKESTGSVIEVCTENLPSQLLLDRVENEVENQIDALPRQTVIEREFTEASMISSADAIQSASHFAESSKMLKPPKTKIRLLQDLLKDRAAFVKTSTDTLVIKYYPQEAVQEDGLDQQEIITQGEIIDEGVKKEKKKFQWHALLEKILTCGQKERGETSAIVENLKGESVPVDIEGKVRDAASATLDSSTMRILQAAKRKRIIQKYIKEK